ncbi:oligopeptide transporter 1-like protein [Cinnamomum micranthum f. kanehirae]|uniref:Oligopeptide transporter 1-like protein n=1 Tax=Cinnamomum micranthum f. kanehirae TaxID=337451 RepID=A0A443P2E2_9MAGN|nr:oligopeptide transporter 1-like protein [Cinnamomum micranthum f. kanehirae]
MELPSLVECNNKENLPCISLHTTSQSPNLKKRKRNPLEDITHLFHRPTNSIILPISDPGSGLSTISPFNNGIGFNQRRNQHLTSVDLSALGNPSKRGATAHDSDAKWASRGKSLRMDFSKVSLTIFFAFTYGLSFATIAATISRVAIFDGRFYSCVLSHRFAIAFTCMGYVAHVSEDQVDHIDQHANRVWSHSKYAPGKGRELPVFGAVGIFLNFVVYRRGWWAKQNYVFISWARCWGRLQLLCSLEQGYIIGSIMVGLRSRRSLPFGPLPHCPWDSC